MAFFLQPQLNVKKGAQLLDSAVGAKRPLITLQRRAVADPHAAITNPSEHKAEIQRILDDVDLLAEAMQPFQVFDSLPSRPSVSCSG